MKKFLALLISVAMVIGFAAVPVAAEGEVTFTVATVNDVNPGDTVAIPVTIGGADFEAHSIVTHLYFDTANLELVSITNGEVIANRPDDAMLIKDYQTNPGDIAIGFICPTEPATTHGVFYTANFRVKESCTTDQILDFNVDEFYNMPVGQTTPNPYPVIVTDGAINLVHQEVTPTPTTPPTPTPTPTTPPTPTPTAAPQPDKAYFEMESMDNVVPGSTITLDFTVSGNYAAHILNARILYVDDDLEVVNVQAGPVLNSVEDAMVVLDYVTPGVISIGAIMPTEPMTAEGAVVSITFKVSAGFKVPTMLPVEIVEFGYLPVGESFAEPVDYEVEDGLLTPAEGVTPEAHIVMGSQYEVPGGTRITLPLTIDGNYEIHTMNLFLNYDADVLTVVGVEKGEVLNSVEDAAVIIDYTTVPGSIRIGAVMPTDGITAEGVIAYVTFDVAEDFAEPTVIEVQVNELGYMPVGQANAEDINYTADNGIVTPVGIPGPSDEPGPGPSDEPGPGPGPNPPITGAASLVGLGIAAIVAGAGIVIFRKKED